MMVLGVGHVVEGLSVSQVFPPVFPPVFPRIGIKYSIYVRLSLVREKSGCGYTVVKALCLYALSLIGSGWSMLI
jgi:hypothetical protein